MFIYIFLFLIIFAAGIYFVINLFRSVPVDEISISGQWQLAGNPKWYLTINADGTASSFEQHTAGKTENAINYTYVLREEIDVDINKAEQKIYFLTLQDVKTGVEMEALTGASAALLTVYDMCKAINKMMEITDIHLCSKTGGKSGEFIFSK